MSLSKKKVIMSVTTSAIVASGFILADEVGASTHKVEPGDTLYSIANKHNTSVTKLKTLNNLKGNIIIPNQVLRVDGSTASNTAKPSTSNKNKNSNTNSSSYTVQAGDTLTKIARAHQISVKSLMELNNLDSTLIFPGNVLTLNKTTNTTTETATNSNSNNSSNSNTNKGGTYLVKQGDTLSKIATQNGVSVANLKSWNNLSSDTIYVNQTLKINGTSANNSSSSTNSNQTNNTDTSISSNSTVYTVKSGDTLSKVASQNGVSVANLKSWNNLSSDTIYIGQKLSLDGKSVTNQNNSSSNNVTDSNPNTGFDVNRLVSSAQSATGVPYVWGGTTMNGFDCSGFIHWAYNDAGLKMGRTSTDGYFNRSYYVNSPQVGDLVFFKNTYRSGISHMGIYIGNNQFIHAGTSSGVTVTSLSNSYWSKHFDSFKRFY